MLNVCGKELPVWVTVRQQLPKRVTLKVQVVVHTLTQLPVWVTVGQSSYSELPVWITMRELPKWVMFLTGKREELC